MRILFVTPPFPGHLFASAPVAEALREAGHQTVYAGMEPARRYVGDSEFVPILEPAEPGEPAESGEPGKGGLVGRLLGPLVSPLGDRLRNRIGSSAEEREAARAELTAYRQFAAGGAAELARQTGADLALVDHAWPFLALPLRSTAK
jgi:hypothetical protein